jgi:hypothetical protein
MSGIVSAVERLESALKRLDGAVEGLLDSAADPRVARQELSALLADRAQLAEDLSAALSREQALQGLADEASAALGSAIEEVRAALGREE